jgi:hypothetical protein
MQQAVARDDKADIYIRFYDAGRIASQRGYATEEGCGADNEACRAVCVAG